MAIEYDGKDLLEYYTPTAIALKKGIEGILDRSRREISVRAIRKARDLFSIALDFVREERGIPIVHNNPNQAREVQTSYRMLRDMLRKTIPIRDNEINPKLQDLANAVNILTPDRRKINRNIKVYQEIRDLFGIMCKVSEFYKLCRELSPYCIGKFRMPWEEDY